MKVLIVFAHPAPYKIKIFNELSKYVELDVIFERESASDRPRAFYNEQKYCFNLIKIKGIKCKKENIFSYGVRSFIKRNYHRYDRIIMNGYATFAEIFAIKYMKKHHINFIQMINGGVIHSNESLLKKHIKTKYLNGASLYLSPNTPSNEYLQYYGVNPLLIRNYHYSNLYKKDIIQPLSFEDKLALKKKHNIAEDKTIFIAAGQFSVRKNNEALIHAMKNVDAQLLLIGSGPQEKHYLEIINNENINNVKIIPFMDNTTLLEYYRLADGFVSLSKEDIFGHTIIEALASNIPVLASNKITAAQALINKDNGLIISDDAPETIKKALITLGQIKNKDISKGVTNYCVENTAKEIYNYIK